MLPAFAFFYRGNLSNDLQRRIENALTSFKQALILAEYENAFSDFTKSSHCMTSIIKRKHMILFM